MYSINTNSERPGLGNRYQKPVYQRNLPSINSTNNEENQYKLKPKVLGNMSIGDKNMSILNTSVESKPEEINNSILQ